jgi:hypothetical protein
MATASKLITMNAREAKKDSPLTPDLKAFIDRVIVPTLVRDYLDVLQRDERVEIKSDSVTPYVSENSALAEEEAS